MKIIWVSNTPNSNSGYGSQTRQVAKRLLGAGYELEFSANDGTRLDSEWEGCLVRGQGRDRYSRDTVREDIRRSKADIAIVLYDSWVYADDDPFEGMDNVWGWCPVDHLPLPPDCRAWMTNHNMIAMSQFGRWAMEASNEISVIRYAPHGIEPVFRPTPVAEGFGKPFRDVIKVPEDAFLVGIVAANEGTAIYDRKGWGDMLQAAGVFMAQHPDAYIYIHSQENGSGGISLHRLAEATGIPEDRVRWADPYALAKQAVSDEQMASIYTSLDVLLATSRGEGFGLPVIEAQACGTPVIVSNWSAQPELLGQPFDPANAGPQLRPSGWLVSADPDYDPRHLAFFAKPRTPEIRAALADAYERRGDSAMKSAAIEMAAQYNADHVFDTYWRPLLAEMEAKLTPKNLAIRPKKGKKAA